MDPAVATTMHGGDETTTTHGVTVNGDIANGGAIPEMPSVVGGDNGEALSKAMEAFVAVDSTPGTVKGDDTRTVAGTVIEVNANVLEEFSVIQDDPYEEGWLLRIEASEEIDEDDEDEDEEDDDLDDDDEELDEDEE